MKISSLFIFLLPFLLLAVTPPEGWQFPKDSKFNNKWIHSNHMKYLLAVGDFNGDNINDTAVILESIDENEFGIFVYLNGTKEIYDIYNSKTDTILNSFRNEARKYKQVINSYKATYGIESIKIGKYTTACGKGFYDCEKGEPEEIILKHNAISFFQFDAGGTRYYYFNNKLNKFVNYFIDD